MDMSFVPQNRLEKQVIIFNRVSFLLVLLGSWQMETANTGHLSPLSPGNWLAHLSTQMWLDTNILLYFGSMRCCTVALGVGAIVCHSGQVRESSSPKAGLCMSAVITLSNASYTQLASQVPGKNSLAACQLRLRKLWSGRRVFKKCHEQPY